MNASVDIRADNRDAYAKAVREQLREALEAIGMHIEGEAKEELSNEPTRVDTGLLRNSITFALGGQSPAVQYYHAEKMGRNQKDTDSMRVGYYSGTAPADPEGKQNVYIGTNVEYAAYVHEGTDRMTPNRFLKNAAERNYDQIERILKNAMKY